jgi:hypothetical protein
MRAAYDRLPALETVAERAKADARNTLPLDNSQVADAARQLARHYAETDYERTLYEQTYYNTFLQELRLVTVERMR